MGYRLSKTTEDHEAYAWGSTIVIPAGTKVRFIPKADGLTGSMWAVEDIALLIKLTGNRHDPKYRYLFVPSAIVEPVA